MTEVRSSEAEVSRFRVRALVIGVVVLAAFCLGLLTGILVMLPRWWQARQQAHAAASPAPAPAESSAAAAHPTTLHEL